MVDEYDIDRLQQEHEARVTARDTSPGNPNWASEAMADLRQLARELLLLGCVATVVVLVIALGIALGDTGAWRP